MGGVPSCPSDPQTDPHTFRANVQQHRDFLECVRRDRLYSDPPSYSRDASPYAKRHSGSLSSAQWTNFDAHSHDSILNPTARSNTLSQEDLYANPPCYSREGSPYARRHLGSQKGVRSDAFSQEDLSEVTARYTRDAYSQENLFDPPSYARDESPGSKRHSVAHQTLQGVQSHTFSREDLNDPLNCQDRLFKPTSSSSIRDSSSLRSSLDIRSDGDYKPNVTSQQDRLFKPTSSSSTRESELMKGHPTPHNALHRVRSCTSSQDLLKTSAQSPTVRNSTVAALEADLAELMEQVTGQKKPSTPGSALGPNNQDPDPQTTQQGPPPPSPSLHQTDATQGTNISKYGNPPPQPPFLQPTPYPSDPLTHTAEVTQTKKGRPKVLSLLRTAPGSLFGSRRGSLDLSPLEPGGKRLQKGGKRSGN